MHRHNDYQWAAMQFHVGYQCSPVERYVPTSPAAAIDSEKLKKNTPRATSRATATFDSTIHASIRERLMAVVDVRIAVWPQVLVVGSTNSVFRVGDSTWS